MLKVADIVQLIFILCVTKKKLLNNIEDKNNIIITFAEETQVNSGIEHVKLLISLHASVKKKRMKSVQNGIVIIVIFMDTT